MFRYTVSCTFADPAVGAEWLAWLRDAHLGDVLAAGARSAEVVAVDGAAARYDVHYAFASRAAFEAYERLHAPRLRAEGLARFPLDRGLTYQRAAGDVVARLPEHGEAGA